MIRNAELSLLCNLNKVLKSKNVIVESRSEQSMSAASDSTENVKPLARIMIVDDDKDIADIIKKGLELNHFQAEAFTDPELALKEFREHSKDYCLVLSDVRMPSLSGFQLCREFEKINPDVRKVLMSSFEIHKDEAAIVLPSTKVDDFVLKPVSIPKLKDTILKHIGNMKRLSDS
jgi:DNA-binding response OmpR family regulator